MGLLQRRILVSLGLILLVGGWALTRYTMDRLDVLAGDSPQQKASLWLESHTYLDHSGMHEDLSGRSIYLIGIVAMIFGAGWMGYALPQQAGPESKKDRS